MSVLIADDDVLIRTYLETTLRSWGQEVVVCSEGREALARLTADDASSVAILDWSMPGLTGPEICQELRRQETATGSTYLILLSTNNRPADISAGLDAGADDYIVKPFHAVELQSRLQAGLRVVTLQRSLQDRVQELEDALGRVKQLHGLLPICCYCHKIRDDTDYWHRVEHYLAEHADVQFSHGICPDCFREHVDAVHVGASAPPAYRPQSTADR